MQPNKTQVLSPEKCRRVKNTIMKRPYQPPTIDIIPIDNEISLILCSDHHHHGHHVQEFEEENEFNNESIWK